jgi:multisubunit Na+/H+ antiporter MnhC subunit
MNPATWYGLVGATLAGIGLYGLIVHPHVLRKILSFNLLGAGVFLIAGVVARHRHHRRVLGDSSGSRAAAATGGNGRHGQFVARCAAANRRRSASAGRRVRA